MYPKHPSAPYSIATGLLLFMILVTLILTLGPYFSGWLAPFPGLTRLLATALGVGGVAFIAFLLTLRWSRREETDRRRMVKADWLQMLPAEFEQHVADLFEARGYQTKVTRREGRVDILVKNEKLRGVVQCKHWLDQKVGAGAVQELATLVNQSNADRGFLVTSGSFSYPAQERARAEPLTLIDGDTLAAWLRAARAGPYVTPFRYPFRFSPGQWLLLILLAPAVIFVCGVWLLR